MRGWNEKNGDHYEIAADHVHSALVAINTKHYEIHEGEFWHTQHSVVVASEGVLEIYGMTGDKEVHFQDRFVQCIDQLSGGIDVTGVLYEGTTVSANGVEIDWFNANRNTEESELLLFKNYEGPTITADGTDIKRGNRIIGDKKSASTAVITSEYIMKKNTGYLLRFTNNSTSAVEIVIDWGIYETNDERGY